MLKFALCIPAAIALAAAAVPSVAAAQTFTVSRYEIGGEGGTDYLTAEAGTRRVFVSRGTHVMVIDGTTGKVIGDIPNTPRTHGIAIAPRAKHGFTTNGGDSTVTVFDLATLAPISKVRVPMGGLDGIAYDEHDDRVILTNHSRPIGTAVSLDPMTGAIVGTAELEDTAPEGAVDDGNSRIFVNNESKNTIQVLDARTMKVTASWPMAPCEGPTGIAYDRSTDRVFAGCGKTSVVVDGTSGRVVATITNGDGVDALGYDASEKLIYIPSGRDGTVTIAHQDSPNAYHVVAVVPTMRGAKTIAVDPVSHVAYLFQPEYGPAPTPAPGTPAPPSGRGGPRGPIIGAWFFAIRH